MLIHENVARLITCEAISLSAATNIAAPLSWQIATGNNQSHCAAPPHIFPSLLCTTLECFCNQLAVDYLIHCDSWQTVLSSVTNVVFPHVHMYSTRKWLSAKLLVDVRTPWPANDKVNSRTFAGTATGNVYCLLRETSTEARRSRWNFGPGIPVTRAASKLGVPLMETPKAMV